MLDIREIPLGPKMTKYHFQQPGIPAMHRMWPDPDGEPHDHPFAMTSFVLYGGYIEEVFELDGSSRFIEHRRIDHMARMGKPASESFLIPAQRIHRIVDTFGEECWTVTLPHAFEQREGVWQFRPDGAYKRTFGSDEWVRATNTGTPASR